MNLTLRPLAAVVVVASSLLSLSSLVVTTTASATTVPECAYATMSVKVGATYQGGGGYGAGTRLVPIFFTNNGVACHLPLSGPEIIAFREAKVGAKTVTQSARPAVRGKDLWVVLTAKARVKALFEIVKLPSASMTSRACGEETATGLTIEGYARPVTKWIYFARKVAGVCFYSGASPATTNVKEVWVGAK